MASLEYEFGFGWTTGTVQVWALGSIPFFVSALVGFTVLLVLLAVSSISSATAVQNHYSDEKNVVRASGAIVINNNYIMNRLRHEQSNAFVYFHVPSLTDPFTGSAVIAEESLSPVLELILFPIFKFQIICLFSSKSFFVSLLSASFLEKNGNLARPKAKAAARFWNLWTIK